MQNSLLNSPLKPTWSRYVNIFLLNSRISVYRALEYEELSRIKFSGKILDFGGGQKAHYLTAIKNLTSQCTYHSVNIAKTMEPTYLVSPDDSLPIPDNNYDMVLSVNTLEHVYSLSPTLSELVRVLKIDGTAVFAVPFLYRVHGCPDDFNRPTASWWNLKLTELGLKNITITPIVWDALTTGFSVTEGAGPFTKLRKIIVPLYGILYAKLRARGLSDRYPQSVSQQLSNLALGYIITGTK